MAEPNVLPLRASVDFAAGTRESILEQWYADAERLGVNARFEASVSDVSGKRGKFKITLADGETVGADNVVLAIGMQGNLRKLGRPGEDLPFVQYQLDDPEAYGDETIAVVGAGDAAIENALGLVKQNRVIVVNTRDEFTRAKDANEKAILQAIEDESVAMECFYDTTVDRVDAFEDDSEYAGQITLDTSDGKAEINVHRVIARIGAIPPRAFVESCGVAFPSDDPNAIPEVTSEYESNVAGLYIVGALAGYPLIEQALNQGSGGQSNILGNEVEPADTPLLREKFAAIPGGEDVPATLAMIRSGCRCWPRSPACSCASSCSTARSTPRPRATRCPLQGLHRLDLLDPPGRGAHPRAAGRSQRPPRADHAEPGPVLRRDEPDLRAAPLRDRDGRQGLPRDRELAALAADVDALGRCRAPDGRGVVPAARDPVPDRAGLQLRRPRRAGEDGHGGEVRRRRGDLPRGRRR
ncbi:MAG: NAD(P)-binding domain-containing protein [Halofilum sp. (in: g-proteobacteria)]|nr:NAD(P)-binding domain-containing protein [Halofilum sp. (in: g-proteobacteria)]